MNLLAIELSSAWSSLAVFRDGALRAERRWRRADSHNQAVFAALKDLLAEAKKGVDEMDWFVAGRGPGNYSGMRLALTLAGGLALPGARPVYAIASGEALAYDVSVSQSVATVAVVGDARRGQLWLGIFQRDAERMIARLPWRLVAPDTLAQLLPSDALVVSSDRSALPDAVTRTGCAWLPENLFPHATSLGRLCVARVAAGIASDPPTPLYLHPAV